jgi:outer membrane protein TolC
LLVAALTIVRSPSAAQVLTLDSAIDSALRRSARGAIIHEKQQIAESNYRAKRISFYVPLLTINGALPSYSVDQSYRLFGASSRKSLYKTSDFGLNSFIQLQQSLLTGGDLTMSANLTSTQNRYPNTDPSVPAGTFLNDKADQGFFDFKLIQPILKPSADKNDLYNRRDDMELARLTRADEENALRKEVTDAYVGLLEAEVVDSLEAVKLEAATIKASVDSSKWEDGVISAEDRLSSASARLDEELARREAADKLVEQARSVALLLDLPVDSTVRVITPSIVDHPGADDLTRMTRGWEGSVAVRRAVCDQAHAKRGASYAASGHGLTGDLTASYSAGRGKVRNGSLPFQDVNTNGWGVSLNVSYPIWDGGASRAASQAARSEANRAQLELTKAKEAAQADITRLANQVDVGYRRLRILKSQIDLATERRAIARERFADDRISRYELLQGEADWLAVRQKYLTELDTYLGNRILLEGSFAE